LCDVKCHYICSLGGKVNGIFLTVTALSNINLVMTSSNRAEMRAIIEFSSDIGKTLTETFKMMHTTA